MQHHKKVVKKHKAAKKRFKYPPSHAPHGWRQRIKDRVHAFFRSFRWMPIFLGCLFLSTPVSADATLVGHAELRNDHGVVVGNIGLTESPDGVVFKVSISGIPAGEHALSVRNLPVCRGLGFSGAGGHFNPDERSHGFNSPDGPHAGDLPNIVANGNGEVETEFVNPLLTLRDQQKNSLFRGRGTSIVVSQREDDYQSESLSAAGPGILCGVITRDPVILNDPLKDPLYTLLGSMRTNFDLKN